MTTLRIKEFDVKNFRGINHFYAAPEGKSLLIEGANGTGKTSLLNALVFAFTGEVFSGLPTNLQRREGGQLEIKISFFHGRAKHELYVLAKANNKFEYHFDAQVFDQKIKYLQALADALNLDDYNIIIDLIHPVNVEASLGIQNNLATKQLRAAFIRAINRKENIFDNTSYLDLKTKIAYKEETQKLLEKEFRIEDDFARKFRQEHNLNEASKSAEEMMQERTDLEAQLTNFETRITLKNRLDSINMRLNDLETKLDPTHTVSNAAKLRMLSTQDVALTGLSLGAYWSAIKRRREREAIELVEQQKAQQTDYDKLIQEKTQTEKALAEMGAPAGEMNLEALKARIIQIENETNERERNRERYQQILNENKEVKNQIEELITEIKLLRVEKANFDARLSQAARLLLPAHLDVALFNEQNEEILDLKVDNVSFEDLNTGEQVRIISAINNVLALDCDTRFFNVLDRFETLSSFHSNTQIFAAKVSHEPVLIAREVDFSL